MPIKLFGKTLFKSAKKGDLLFAQAESNSKESKYLPDFQKSMSSGRSIFDDFILAPTNRGGGMVAIPKAKKGTKVKKTPVKPKTLITPKGVFEMKMLHEKSFTVNTNPEYVDKQIADFKAKADLIKGEEYDMRRGVEEIESILVRMENRKKYSQFQKFYEEFPYTTPTKVAEVLKGHDHLQLGQVAQFLADMPTEAVDSMKKYEKNTLDLCGKKPVFYIIADKKDFQKSEKRRDPILLAQSPFGHFWQILGAWDEEMLLLESL